MKRYYKKLASLLLITITFSFVAPVMSFDCPMMSADMESMNDMNCHDMVQPVDSFDCSDCNFAMCMSFSNMTSNYIQHNIKSINNSFVYQPNLHPSNFLRQIYRPPKA